MASRKHTITTRSEYNASVLKEKNRMIAMELDKKQIFQRIVKSHKPEDENEFSSAKRGFLNIADDDRDLDYRRKELRGESKHLKLDVSGGELENILDNSAAKHKISIRPKRKYPDSRQTNSTSDSTSKFIRTTEEVNEKKWIPASSSSLLQHASDKYGEEELDVFCKREAVVNELLETEEEFCKDLVSVVEKYIKPSESCCPPAIRDNMEVIFSNFKLIANFHNEVLLEGIKYCSSKPLMLGKTFLRLERDFDRHIAYCRDVSLAQEFLAGDSQAAEFFEELSQKAGDEKSILDYLKLPAQRINDYQVLLKDLVKYSEKLGENSNDLKKALELMLAIPQRANDNKFLNNIEGFSGNIHNLGRLLRHDWFTVESADCPSKERYLFLFNDHIIICKVKKISEDRSVFNLKDLISLSEVKIRNPPEESFFEILSEGNEAVSDRIKVHARKESVKTQWLEEIKKHVPGSFVEERRKSEEESKEVEEETRVKNDSREKERLEETTNRTVSSKKDSINGSTARKSSFLETKSTADKKSIEEIGNQIGENMSRRFSKRTSLKSYEESYSVSGNHELSYQHSSTISSRKFSSSSLASHNYESSISSGTATRSIGSTTLKGFSNLALKGGDSLTFSRPLRELNVEPGETAVFECQLETEAQLVWLKDNKALEDDLANRMVRSSSDDGTHRLELQNVSESDSGTYTAVARNDSDYAASTAQLVVEKVSHEEIERRKEAKAPFFSVRLKDTTLMKNTNFTFVVKVKGTPDPEVKFYKDDVPIRSGDAEIIINREMAEIGFYELHIPRVRGRHAGVYSCRATNSFGEARCEGTVTVTDEKVAFKGFENDDLLTPGEKPSFTWFKDGKSFDPDERFKVLLGNEDDSLALIFQHVKPDDAGLYTCVASTTAGKISCSAELSVQGIAKSLSREPEKPKISREVKSVEASVGGKAMLEAKITGFPQPEVKWYHDDVEIKAEGRYKFLYEDRESVTLIIRHVNPEDCGSYKIMAKNELGEDCTELNLTVKGAPKITRKLKDFEANLNSVIEITTTIEGYPTPDVKWYKDGKEITESERIRILKNSSNHEYGLIIEKAVAGDEGSYSVEASNDVNRCSDSCSVKLLSATKIVKKMEKNVEVTEGEDLTFEIELSAGSETKVTWMKDEEILKSDETKRKITVEGDVHCLTILRAQAEDSGTYSVEVSNEQGVVKDEGKARVKAKASAPEFRKPLKDIVAKEGDTDVEFSVEVTAYPKPRIRWYLDEMEITERRKEYARLENENNYKLIVKKVTTELSGNYKCRVENDWGTAETTAILTVHSKPVFVKVPESKVVVDEGADLTLQIECSGCPEPEISWFKDGQEIETDAHITIKKDSHRTENCSMTLNLIRSSDGGDYEARATNCMGSATTKTFVQVFSKITEKSEEETAKSVEKGKEVEETLVATSYEEEEAEERDRLSVLQPPKTRVHFPEINDGGFKVEEIDENSYAEERESDFQVTLGVVEECLESENVADSSYDRLRIDRGVSIVSLSEDERTLSRNNSGIDLNEKRVEKSEEVEIETTDMTEERRKSISRGEIPRPEEPEEEEEDDFWGSSERAETVAVEERRKVETFEAPSKPGETGEAEDSSAVGPDAKSKSPSKKTEPESDTEEDPVVDALLKRIQKQRSVLEEILNKEADAGKGDVSLKPSFSQRLKDQKASEKTSVTFKCVIVSDSELEITWTHNDEEIKIDGVKFESEKISKKVEEDNKGTEFTCTLKISNTGVADAGLYLIKAKNKFGYDESSANLTIQVEETSEKPVIKKLKDVTTVLSEKVVFEAEIISSTFVEVNWYNDKEEKIVSDDRIILTDDKSKGIYKMTIKSTKEEDLSEYVLVAANEAGEARERVKLSLHGEIPSFVRLLKDSEVRDGEDIDLLVRCNGIPKPEVNWYKDGERIVELDDGRVVVKTQTKGQVSSSLSVHKFSVEDAGEYKVTASNHMGTAENTFKLSMARIAPVLERGLPRSMEVEEGETLELKCKITGSPKAEVKWTRNGEPLVNAEDVKMVELPDGFVKLSIHDMTPDKSGTYGLVAENPDGQITSQCPVSVQPKPSKPKFIEDLKDVTGEQGQPVRLEAKIISYSPPEIKWFKDGRPLRPSQGIPNFDRKDGKLELQIVSLKPEHAGVYSVKVINKLGEVSQEAKIEVLEGSRKPKFDSVLTPVTAVEGSPAKFSVKANGNPKPEIKWYRNGEEIVLDGNHAIESEPDGTVSLVVDKCAPEDEGEYMAVATNDLGECSCKAPLEVLKEEVLPEEADDTKEDVPLKPSFKRRLKDQSASEKTSVTFKCVIVSDSELEITWMHNDEEIKIDGVKFESERDSKIVEEDNKRTECTCTLKISNTSAADAGLYLIKAKNKYGYDESSANLTIQVEETSEKPVIKKLKDVTTVLSEKVVFEAEIISSTPVEVNWYNDKEEKIVSDDRIILTDDKSKGIYKMTIKCTKEEDLSEYVLVAINEAGEAREKVKLSLHGEIPSFVRLLKDSEVRDSEDIDLLVRCNGIPKPDINWYKDGERIVELDDGRVVVKTQTKGQVSSSLSVHKFSVEDVGEYKVTASNYMGTAENTFKLSMARIAPVLERGLPRSMEVEEGETLELKCKITGSPKAEVKWTRNGEPLVNAEDVKMVELPDGFVKLSIHDMTPDKSGTYGLVAENPDGQITSQCPVSVQPKPSKPKFIEDLKDVAGEQGQPVRLEAKIISYSPPEIKWFKDGRPLRPSQGIPNFDRKDGKLELQIVSLKPEHAGVYSVKVINKLGEVSQEAKIEVLEGSRKPKFDSVLTPVTAVEGSPAKFSVKANGNPKPEIKWYRNGEEIVPDANHAIESEPDGTVSLVVDKCAPEDEGEYMAVATNDLGECSCKAPLEVLKEEVLPEEADDTKEDVPIKPSFIRRLKDQIASEKTSITFKCVIVSDSELEITWTHNDKEIKIDGVKFESEKISKKVEEDNKRTEFTCTLKISNTSAADAGLYLIKAKNKYGYDESSANLTIRVEETSEKPVIKKLKDVSTVLSERAVFEAEIISSTPVEVTWYNDKEEKIVSDDRIILTDEKSKRIYKLTIKSTKEEDFSDYVLVAANEAGEARERVKLSLHGEIPSFVRLLKDSEVRDSEDIDLLVRCNGIPKPEVNWYKDGERIVELDDGRVILKTQTEGQVSSSLSVHKFSVEDVGEYKVTASNYMGTAENTFKLSMARIAPVLERGLPRSMEVEEGETLELKCKITGSPKAEVKWTRNGEPLVNAEDVKMVELPDGFVKLSIHDMTPDKSGTYGLVAENPDGQITSQCPVSVQPKPSKPKFIEDLKDVTGEQGQPVRLEAKIVSYSPPEIKWFKDGRPLRPSQGIPNFDRKDGKLELQIVSLKPEHAGVYSVKVINKLGEVSQEAKIEVLEGSRKPKFDSVLTPVTAVEGSPAKFSVKANGNPKPEIKWYRNGEEIVPDANHAIESEPDGTVSLLVDKCAPEDEGEYMAVATNDLGECSCKAPLKVLSKTIEESDEEKPSFLRPLNNGSVDEGSDLILSAPISGNPIPDVVWEKDGEPLKSDHRILPTCDGKKVVLELKSCKPTDSGVYTCHLRNRLGEAKTDGRAEVKKIFKEPVFEKKFKDTEQVLGNTVEFVAKISGNPKPEVEWSFNGEPLMNGGRHLIKCDGNSYSLTVRDCNSRDGGLYRCSAFNRAGKAECVAQLKVVQKTESKQRMEEPSFLKKINDREVYKGMSAKFTACCAGFPNPDFEWFKDGVKLISGGRIKMDSEDNGLIRLIISGVTENDVGAYRLRIFNPHGEADCSARLICEDLEQKTERKPVGDRSSRSRAEVPSGGLPSALTDKPIISRMTDRVLTLSWKPYIPMGQHPPVTYTIEMCKKSAGDWFTARRGIRSCACDIRNLDPFEDYKFRVRVENKYGISDPSPYAETYREKIFSNLGPGPRSHLGSFPAGYRPEGWPKDYDLERPPHDRHQQAPEFLRQEQDVQYGVKNQNSSLFWIVYGYPKPTMSYYFNDEPVEMGGRFECSYTRDALATLFINRMLERDVGTYEAVARNEHGEARQRVRLEISEHPAFIQRPEESWVMLRTSGTLTARLTGVPCPEVKWYKDWQPLAESSRIKFRQTAPDTYTLTISDAIFKDEGLYSITATNVAGTVTSSVMLHVEDNEERYDYATYRRGRDVRARREPFSSLYDIGDELGRGTQGITYHAAERSSGENYAAKFMHGRPEMKPFMLNELNVMNSLNHRKLIRIHDSFETRDLLVLVLELAGGGELLEWLTKQTYTTETEIVNYIRQILWGLEYMHSSGYAHLSLTLNDLLLSRPDGDDLKICDFSLSRRITRENLFGLNYGMPEFVAPEVVNKEGVGYPADLWSLGVITYILLSGFSPFKGSNDRETLTRIKEGRWKFEEDYFSSVSSEARDFISKLLTFKAEDRMDVKTALRHPWLQRGDQSWPDEPKIDTTNLRNYYSSLRDWYKNANCRAWQERQPLDNAFDHPSRMVYPPGEDRVPEREIPSARTTRNLGDRLPAEETLSAREPLDYEVGNFKSESHYQYGPDTYLLQLRDVDLPCRLRHYMKVAANRHQGFSSELPERHIDWRTPVIRERRKFTDVMDEEIDDERRDRIRRYGSDEVTSLRRLKHEIGCRSEGRAEAEAMLECKRDGRLPFFREKPRNLVVVQNEPAELSCLVVGDPEPTVQWFKNDLVLAETSRIKMLADANNRFVLKFDPACQSDAGTYKVVAKNAIGQTIARTRVIIATVPLSPDPPTIADFSDTEVLLKWRQESDDVFAPVLCYSLQYRQSDETDWVTEAKNIDHEFWIVKNLKPETSYVFRLSSKNCIGWSAPGLPAILERTKEPGSAKIEVPEIERQMQTDTEIGSESTMRMDSKWELNYEVENSPIEWDASGSLEEKIQIKREISRGRFSSIVEALDKSTGREVVAKVFEVDSEGEKRVAREFDNIKSLKHERIVSLLSALRPSPNVAVFVMEKLQGTDILSYFASRKEYNEDMVVTVLTQVLDGLQYLHWRSLCHLNLQPDNIVLSRGKGLQIKLVDFGFAQRVSKLGTIVNAPFTDFAAPEVINGEPAFPQSDLWSLGTIAYVLLSGVSPFRGDTDNETKENITFVRYRFEHLYKELTQEATRFLMQIFKRTPSKRPTVDECYETRWFLSSEHMIKKRLKASFPGSRLKEFDDAYHREKTDSRLCSDSVAGISDEKPLSESNSTQEETVAA